MTLTLRFPSTEIGPIGYIVPWTVNSVKPASPWEYGYSYTFAPVGQPAAPLWPTGVTIDSDTGLVSTSAPVAQGTYTLALQVTNRRNTALISTFAVTLQIDAGVTSGRTGTQFLIKTYDPHSGTYGTVPASGGNWTTVFNNINTAILADQEISGNDNNVWAKIPLRGNFVYNYTNNRWACGAQFLEVYQDTTNFPGTKPQLCCNQTTFSFDIEVAPIQAGGGSVFDFVVSNPNPKTYASLIAAANPGDSTITLLNSANASNLRVGRWHMVLSLDQQGGGGPPNSRYYDYVKVTGISGATVTLDRQIRHKHSPTYWERYPQDAISFGQARIVPMDVGGVGGVEHGGTNTLVRLTQRGKWTNVTFLVNPNHSADESIGTFCYTQGLETYFDSCTLPYPVPSITKMITYINCTIPQRIEQDKLIDLNVMDGCTVSGEGYGNATGVEMMISRNTHVAQGQMSPRQMYTIGDTWDIDLALSLGSPSVQGQMYPGIPGPQMRMDLYTTTFKSWNSSQPSFLAGIIYFKRDVTVFSGTIGTDFTWSSNRLVIPVGSAQFLNVLGYAYEGMIIIAGNDPSAITSWGYITNVTSPGDGSALWLDVTWVTPSSTHPASGVLGFDRCGHVTISGCTIGSAGTIWSDDGAWLKATMSPNPFGTDGVTHDWPSGGYPWTGF